MSIQIKGVASKSLATLVMLSTVLSIAGFAAMPIAASAVAPADYGLHEGDTISAVGSNDPDIYIVNDWGYKRLFVNPAIFTLYGHLSWAGVKSVAASTRDAFVTSGLFRNCETGDQKVYGLDVISEDVANLRWVNTTGAQAVADDANFFKKVFCINSREQALYGVGADYTSVLQVPVYSRAGSPVVAGNVSVSLASDNPVSNTLIETQAAADLAHFSFTGSGAVTSVVLQRLGVSSDTTLANVYLYSGSKRLTDAATVSSGKITFSDTAGLFTVNGSMNIAVKADIADTTTGQTIGVQLTGVNGNAVSLSGNLFTIAVDPTDFATVAVGAPTPASTLTLDPQNDYTMWQSTVTIGNHDTLLKSLQLRVIGSVLPGDLRNFRLYADGTQIGSTIAQQDAAGYLVFDFGAGVTLRTGGRVLKLVGDVVGGSNKSFIISLRQKPDISVYDSQYGAGLLATGTFPATAPTQTAGTEVQAINTGTLTITKATDSPSGDVIKDATSVSLVKYKFEAHGEALKIESLRANFTASAAALSSLRNGAIYVDGAQVGSIQSLCEDTVSAVASCSGFSAASYTLFNLGSSLVVQPGTPRIVEIRADIYDNAGTNNAAALSTIIAQVIAGSSNVQRMTSLSYFSNTAATVGSTLTIKTGSFNAAKYTGYASQSVVTPKSAFKIGHFTLTAASSEDVNVNTVTVDTASVSANELYDTYLVVKSDTGSTVYTSSPKSTLSITASNSYSVNFTIPKTKTYQVEVYSNIQSKVGANDAISINMGATGLTTASSTSVTAADAAGQTITGASGTLTLANGSNPASSLVAGATTKAVYVFTLQPQYDDFYLDEASFNLSSTVASSTGAIAMAYLKEGSTILASSPITSTSSGAMDFSGMNLPLSQSSGIRTFTVELALSSVGVGANDTGADVTVRLERLKYRSSTGTITNSVLTAASYSGNEMRVVKAYPTFSNVSLPSTVLAPGTQTLLKTTASAVGGAVAWRKVVFNLAVTLHPTINAFQLFENGVDITAVASNTIAYGEDYATVTRDFNVAAAAGSGKVIFMFNTDRSIPANGSVTLELKGNVGGANVAGDSITTSIINPRGSTFAVSEDLETYAGTVDSWDTVVTSGIVWTDSSAPSHATTTDDWMTDGLVTGLGMSQSLYQ